MPEEPEGPLVVTYLLTLPHPVPIQDMATHTVMGDEEEPFLEGVEYSPVQGVTTGEARGRNLVSLQFLQHREESNTAMARQLRAMRAVVEHVVGTGNLTDPPRDKGVEAAPDTTTLVLAATFARDREHIEESETRPDALTRCIDTLLKTHRALRLQRDALIPELTYESIFPMVPWFTRPAFATRGQHLQGFMMLNHANFGVMPQEPMDDDDHEQMALRQIRLHSGDPFMLYGERRLEARRSIWVLGRYDESCVQTAIAAEVLLGGLLGLMLWEEFLSGEISTEGAAEILSSDIIPRIKNQYAGRLGGSWGLSSGVMGNWKTHIADLRNRVVHAGYRPTNQEASQGLVALEALERFVGDRLSIKVREYTRTAWSFLGEGGFDRRGNLVHAKRRLDLVEGDPPNWIEQYRQWRTAVDAVLTRRG